MLSGMSAKVTSDGYGNKPLQERRRVVRRRTLKTGEIATSERLVTFPCAIRNISDLGAQLRLSGTVLVPDTFELIVQLDGLEADCRVIWHEGMDLGVAFLGLPRRVAPKRTQVVTPLVPPGPPTLRRNST
jgi:hypothetical protein